MIREELQASGTTRNTACAEVAQLLLTGLDGIRCSTSDLWPHLVRLHCGAVLKDACPRQLGEGSAKL